MTTSGVIHNELLILWKDWQNCNVNLLRACLQFNGQARILFAAGIILGEGNFSKNILRQKECGEEDSSGYKRKREKGFDAG